MKIINPNKKSFKNIINQCMEISNKSNMLFRHTACIIKSKKIIEFGFSHYCNSNGEFSTHAEEHCLKKYFKKNNKNTKKIYKMLVLRFNKEYHLRNSKPCQKCLNILKKNNFISHIIYSNNNEQLICEKTNNMVSDHVTRGTKIYYNKL